MEIRVIASGSSGNATYINDGITSLLLDAGISYSDLQKGTGFRLSGVAGCLVTHAHMDHSKAVKDLAKRGTDLYSSAGTFLRVCGLRRRIYGLHRYVCGSFIGKSGYRSGRNVNRY